MIRLAVIGEYRPAFAPHLAVEGTLTQVRRLTREDLRVEWIPTDRLAGGAVAALGGFHGLWISPGSPYRSTEGALAAIRYGREARVPLLGTCGGFQHVVLEFARQVLGLADAAHAELEPEASRLVVTPLSCSPAGQTMPVILERGSRPVTWYGATEVREQYFCNYGINPEFEAAIHQAGLRIVGRDPDGGPRLVDLAGHPFFVGALFVPEPSPRDAHPLVLAWVRAAREEAGRAAARRPTPTSRAAGTPAPGT